MCVLDFIRNLRFGMMGMENLGIAGQVVGPEMSQTPLVNNFYYDLANL